MISPARLPATAALFALWTLTGTMGAGSLAAMPTATPSACAPHQGTLTAGPETSVPGLDFTLCGSIQEGAISALAAPFSLSMSYPDEPSQPKGPEPEKEKRPKKKWGRALLETGVFLSYSTIRYWIEYSEFIEDWQYELTWEDQFRRFFTTEALRFDSNSFSVNWTHGLAGALYYQLARSNRLSAWESLLMTTGGSLFYEYVGEWREVISINDMIITSIGGYPLGESWFQLGTYFHHRKSLFPRILGFLNPFVEFNQWLDRKDPASRMYVEPGWHDMEITAGWRRHAVSERRTVNSAFVGFDLQILHVPEYGRPGVFRRTLRNTVVSEMTLDLALRDRLASDPGAREGLDDDLHFSTRVVGWASYRQNIDELSRGYAVSLGLGSAFCYVRKRPVAYDERGIRVNIEPPPAEPVDFRDKLTVIHMIGPVLDWTRFGRGWKLRSVTDAYLDFAMVGSAAINEYSRVREIDGLKTTLKYYGYHYGFGASFFTRLDLEWKGFLVRGLLSGHVWDSVEGIDRYQDGLANDANAVDTRVRYFLRASWRLPGAPIRVFAAYDGLHRWGRIEDIEGRSSETKISAGLSFTF